MEDILLGLAGWGYVGLFIAAFLAATVLPFSSEVVFSAVVLAGLDLWTCTWVATIGNCIGGMTCYGLGLLGKTVWIERYLKIPPDKLQRFQTWLHDKGSWSAFFVFLPGVGDIIAVALGFLRANAWQVAFWMFLGKLLRYIVWMKVVYGVIDLF